MRLFFAVSVLVLGLACAPLGCDKTSRDSFDAGTQKETPSVATPSNVASARPPSPAKLADARLTSPATNIEGVGDVPAWAPDKTTKRCTTSEETKTRLEAIAKGTDAVLAASFAAGRVDIVALVKDTGADDCIVTRRRLANALNDAGRARFDAKKVDEANRYWRAALSARPSLVVARYDLARGLALAGKAEPAAGQLAELVRAANEGDANAASDLEKAKSDKDLESVRAQPAFQSVLAATDAGAGSLVGPRKEPETSAKAVALLPEGLKKEQDDIGATPNRAIVTFKPAFTNFWTWHPDASTELLVATVVDDPAKIGQPKADLTLDYGAIAVLRRDAAGKLTLLTVRKTGYAQPTVAAGKNGSVIYSFEQMCGGLSGALTWNGNSIDMNEKSCRDLP